MLCDTIKRIQLYRNVFYCGLKMWTQSVLISSSGIFFVITSDLSMIIDEWNGYKISIGWWTSFRIFHGCCEGIDFKMEICIPIPRLAGMWLRTLVLISLFVKRIQVHRVLHAWLQCNEVLPLPWHKQDINILLRWQVSHEMCWWF